MTRREQIDAQAKSLEEEFAKEQGIDPREVQYLGLWFKLGCSWADKNPNGSRIEWQTGEPKEEGVYLVTTIFGEVKTSTYMKAKAIDFGVFSQDTVAWCKLSDIEPYKEKE